MIYLLFQILITGGFIMNTLTLKHAVSSIFFSGFLLCIVTLAPEASAATTPTKTGIPIVIERQSDSKQLINQRKSLPSLPSAMCKPTVRRVFVPRGSCIRPHPRLTQREIRARYKAFKKMVRRWRILRD